MSISSDNAPLTDADGTLLRRPLVKRLLRERGDALVLAGLGSATYDVAATGDRADNFYFWGAMGLTAVSGLGLALARPDRRIVVLTGDGDMMMGIGSLAPIAAAAPRNLAILVLDNKSFGETGGQAGLSAGVTDIAAMARGAGFAYANTMRTADGIDRLVDDMFEREGPVLYCAEIAASDDPKVLPARDGALLAQRFREAIAEG